MGKSISFIVPVYNVEKYLENCIESILNQDIDDYEIIAINDGSTDGSFNILKKYEGNERVKIYNKENGGLSDARNYGLSKASGRYIIFLDSDDFIIDGSMKNLLRELSSNKDIYIGKYLDFAEKTSVVIDEKVFRKIKENKLGLEYYIENSDSYCPAWRYIVKREYIAKNNLQFIKGRLHEDLFWTSLLLDNADTDNVKFIDVIWYGYRTDISSSITKNLGFRNLKDVFECVSTIENRINSKVIKNRLTVSLYGQLNLYFKLKPEEKLWVEEFIESNIGLFKSKNIKYSVFYLSLKLIGANKTLKLARKFI